MHEPLPFAPLEQLATVIMGQSPDSATVNGEEVGLPFLQGCAEFGRRSPVAKIHCHPPLRVAQAGSTLISVRAPVGTVNRADQDYCIGRGLGAVLALPGHSNGTFLHNAIQHNVSYLRRRSQGSTFLAIASSDLLSMLLPAPELKLQIRIAGIFSTIDDAIEHTEALITKTQQIKTGLMHDLFTRGVTPDGQLRPPREQAPELYKESPLGWIPKDWDLASFTDLVDFPSGQVDPRVKPFSDWVLLAPDHIESRTGRILATETAHAQGAISGKYAFLAGDVVYSKIRPYLRKAVLATFGGLCSADMYPLRPTKQVSPKYLHELVLSEHFSRFAEAVSMRSGFPKVNRDELSSYTTFVAKSAEQEVVATMSSKMDNGLSTLYEQLSKLTAVKQGLMQDLLTGRVRVPVHDATLPKTAAASMSG